MLSVIKNRVYTQTEIACRNRWQHGVFDEQKAALDAIGADEVSEQNIFGGSFDRLFSQNHTR